MRGYESFAWSNISATPAKFSILGGTYVLDAVATWGGGSAKLQRVGPDGTTLIDAATSLTANGTSGALSLTPGTYQLTIATATAVYASLTRIPGE